MDIVLLAMAYYYGGDTCLMPTSPQSACHKVQQGEVVKLGQYLDHKIYIRTFLIILNHKSVAFER